MMATMTRVLVNAGVWSLAVSLALGCGGSKEGKTDKAESQPQGPAYPKIATEGEDPADNGPGDETELDAIQLGGSKVVFSHFTHASNTAGGYKIPCRICHHTTHEGQDVESGCSGCHEPPEVDDDPALYGPEDNLMLDITEDAERASVRFTHFRHASKHGYKQVCSSCHHTGDLISCDSCHGEVSMDAGDGQTIPKLKRAFHLQCIGCHKAARGNAPDSRAPLSCDACHQGRTAVNAVGHLTTGGNLKLPRAYHLQCIGCHQDVRDRSPEAKAPTRRCAGCHKDGVDVQLKDGKVRPGDSVATATASEEGAQEIAAPSTDDEEAQPGTDTDTSAVAASDTATDTSTGSKDGFDAGGHDEKKGPERILIKYAQKSKTPTPFGHWEHQEFGEPCKKCHHTGLDEPTCSACHDGPDEAKKAFHGVCIGCHKENGIDASCASCHPKG